MAARRSPERANPLGTAAIVLGAFAVGLGVEFTLSAAGDSPLQLAVAAQLLVVLLGLMGLHLRDKAVDIFNPMTIVLATFPLMYTLQAVLVGRQSDAFSTDKAPWLYSEPAVQVRSAAVALLALTLLLVGYFAADLWSPHALFPRLRRVDPRLRAPRLGFRQRRLVIVAVGAVLFLLLIASVGGPRQLVENLFNRTVFLEGKNYLALGPLLMFGAVAGSLVVEDRWPPRTQLVYLGLAAIALSALSGSKANILIELLLVGAIVHFKYARIRLRTVLATATVLVILLTAYDLYFRNALARGVSLRQAVAEQGGYWSVITEKGAANSFFGHQALAISMAKFPREHPHLGIDAYSPVLLAPVPRAILPKKPPPTASAFTESFAPDFLRGGSSVPTTAIGEMYVAFGVTGVAVGSVVVGVLLRWAYLARLRGPRGLFTCALTSALTAHYLRGETYAIVVLFLMILLPGLWVVGRGAAGPRGLARTGQRVG